jgi:hypothetical protein
VSASRYERTTPCTSCPYRKDSKLKLWHKAEFENLLMQDAERFGAMYNCHGEIKKPAVEQGPCIGWLLDQKKRGLPNLNLRVLLMRSEEAAEHFKKISAEGLKMFRSIAAMCRANGVRGWSR